MLLPVIDGHAFELASRHPKRSSPDSDNFAPLQLQDSLTWKIFALPYQKSIFSGRRFHEEFKYADKYDIGSGTKIVWLKIFGFGFLRTTIFYFLLLLLQGPYLIRPLILSVTLHHIWIPHNISFQEIYNYRMLLFSKRKFKNAKICKFRKKQQ